MNWEALALSLQTSLEQEAVFLLGIDTSELLIKCVNWNAFRRGGRGFLLALTSHSIGILKTKSAPIGPGLMSLFQESGNSTHSIAGTVTGTLKGVMAVGSLWDAQPEPSLKEKQGPGPLAETLGSMVNQIPTGLIFLPNIEGSICLHEDIREKQNE